MNWSEFPSVTKSDPQAVYPSVTKSDPQAVFTQPPWWVQKCPMCIDGSFSILDGEGCPTGKWKECRTCKGAGAFLVSSDGRVKRLVEPNDSAPPPPDVLFNETIKGGKS